MKFPVISCGLLVVISVSCADLALIPGYVRRHNPVITPHDRACDYRYDLKSKRGVIDLIHLGLREKRSETYTVRFVNHGKEFKITRRSQDGWTTVGEGQTVELRLPPPDIGFQITNQRSQKDVPIRESVKASITFLGLPCEMADQQLIESCSGL